MVNIISILLVAAAGIAFFGLNGVGRAKAFAESFQSNGSGSSTIQESLSIDDAIQTSTSIGSIVEKRKNATKTQVRFGIIDDPTQKEIKTLSGRGTAQFSGGKIGRLTQSEINEIRNRELSAIEQEDVKRLEARRQRAIDRGINPNVKLSGAELVLRKREQEALSKKFLTSRFGKTAIVGGKLFANPDFESGGLTPALRAERARNAGPTIGKQGQIIENLGAGGNVIIKARNEARVAAARAFNEDIRRRKALGEKFQ